MKQFLNATNSTGQEIMVDPNNVKMNAAGTNMSVACYPEKDLDRGDKRPKYVNFHHLKFDPDDKEKMEKIFKEKAAQQAARVKAEESAMRRAKKATTRNIA